MGGGAKAVCQSTEKWYKLLSGATSNFNFHNGGIRLILNMARGSDKCFI